jgi:hypothetical protein
MMKAKIILACLVILVFSLSMHKVLAQPPSPPCVFYGYVSVGGKPALDGLKVTAVIRGATLNWTTETRSGTYGWGAEGSSDFWIPSNDPETPGKNGGATGDWVEFYVQGVRNVETAFFESMGVKRFDLSIPEIPEQPETKSNSTLTASLDCPSAFVGYKVEMSGGLAYTNGTGISGANLSLKYMNASGRSWSDMASVTTTIDGNYYAEWTPPNATGNYLIKVSWEGNKTVEGAEANIILAATSPEGKYVFSVISNSAVSGLTYDSANRALTFSLSGPSGITGYTNLTIAKELVGEISGLKVYLDESIVYYTANSNDASWLLHFTYQQSDHIVTVNLSPPTEPFQVTSLEIAAIVIVVAVAAGMTYVVRRKRKQPEKSNVPEDEPRKPSEKRRPPPWKFEKTKGSHGPK